MAAIDYFDLRSRIASRFPHLSKDQPQEKSIAAVALANFINHKPQPRRSYSCFRDGDNDDGWSNIKKMESYRDLDKARLDIRGKSLDLLDKIKPMSAFKSYDVISIESAFAVAAEAVNHAQWSFDAANRAIAAANKSAAAAVAVYNAATAAPSPASEAVPMDYEREIKRFSEEARKALDYYKDTKDEDFELVEITNFETSLCFPYWITHVTFTAKPKDDIPDSCPKLFFAEVYERGDHLGEYEVKMCMTLDPSGPDVMNGCGYVKHDMPHPKGVKFWAGPPSGTPEWDEENDIGSSSFDAR